MTERPCTKCRWFRASLLSRLFRDYAGAECRHPTVRAEWKNNAKHSWLIGDKVFDPNNRQPDPVTGDPGQLYVYADEARSPHRPLPSFIKTERPFSRAPANCGPDGRYWEPQR